MKKNAIEIRKQLCKRLHKRKGVTRKLLAEVFNGLSVKTISRYLNEG